MVIVYPLMISPPLGVKELTCVIRSVAAGEEEVRGGYFYWLGVALHWCVAAKLRDFIGFEA